MIWMCNTCICSDLCVPNTSVTVMVLSFEMDISEAVSIKLIYPAANPSLL